MSCLLTNGVTRGCDFGFGGLQTILLANKSEIESMAKNTDDTITGITMATGATFYEFQFEPETGQALQELQVGSPSRFVLQTLNMQLANVSQSKKNVLNNLANGDLVAIYEDQKDQYFLFGELGRGLRASTLTIDTGTADADGYIVTIALVGGNSGYANEVESSVVQAYL